MPSPALSPNARVRSRTSDISDFLRGRHDSGKSSSDLPPPPLPHLPADQLTTPKSKSKFAFLGRKRKPSFTPSPTKAAAAAAAAAATIAAAAGGRQDDSVPGGSQPSPSAGSSARPLSRDLPPLPPLSIIAPGYQHPTRADNTTTDATPSPTSHLPQYASPSAVIQSMRKQKGSSESSRRSTDSRSSVRPIITVSPPHNVMHENANAYISPRSAPRPSASAAPPHRLDTSSLPTPSASDRTTTPESQTSIDIPSPSSSYRSLSQLPSQSPSDGPPSVAQSYQEETLLRKDHFEIGNPEAQLRRGTVSSSNDSRFASPSRNERRHISVVQLDRLKKEITGTPPKIRKMPSDLTSRNNQSARESSSLSRSNTISTTPPQTADEFRESRSPTPQGRKVPPPLKRTWHKPPVSGPPKEPLPSPPSSAKRMLHTPTALDSARSSYSPASSPVSLRRMLPSAISTDIPTPRAQSAASSVSRTSMIASSPTSPSRSDHEGAPSARTPVREDMAQRVLADEHATAEQLREALRVQMEKYARLSAYLLGLTERHALEKAELMRKMEGMEQSVVRYERELKGLKWLLAHGPGAKPGPARADSNTLPANGRKVRDRSGSATTVGTTRSPSMRSIGSEGRMSIDSGSVEEGLVELQSTIAEFIEPVVSSAAGADSKMMQPSMRESVVTSTTRSRLKRSNTLPGPVPASGEASIAGGPLRVPAPAPGHQFGSAAARAKMARRTSSPVVPSTTSSPAVGSPSAKSPSASTSASPKSRYAAPSSALAAGLGLGLSTVTDAHGRDGSLSPPSFSRSPSPDQMESVTHARNDSSTLSSLPSLATIHSSSSGASGLSSIPETPRTDVDVSLPPMVELVEEGSGRESVSMRGSGHKRGVSASSASSGGSVSASPSIGQVLEFSRPPKAKTQARTRAQTEALTQGQGQGQGQAKTQQQHQQPEMDTILRRLRAFGHGHSP